MTVAELIEELKKQPQEMTVNVYNLETSEYTPVNAIKIRDELGVIIRPF